MSSSVFKLVPPTKIGNAGGRYTVQFYKCTIWDARDHLREELQEGAVFLGRRPRRASVLETSTWTSSTSTCGGENPRPGVEVQGQGQAEDLGEYPGMRGIWSKRSWGRVMKMSD